MTPGPWRPVLAAAVVAGGAVAATALLAGRRAAALRAELVEVRASRARILAATDDARRTAERVLHDGAQQRLLSVALALRMARAKLAGAPADPARRQGVELLEEAAAELATALAELRELARGMYPVLLTDAGLGPALAALVERSPVPAELVAAPQRRFARAVEQTCYFVVAGTLAAAAADDRARVTVRERGGLMDVEVSVVGEAPPVPGLADRVAALGGALRVDGTRVRAVLPCG